MNFQPNQLKNIMHYVIKKGLIDKIEPKFFADSDTIQKIFTSIKKYYRGFGSIPTTAALWMELNNGEDAMDRDIMMSAMKEDEIDEDYLEDLFNRWITANLAAIEVHQAIDEVRSDSYKPSISVPEYLGLEQQDDESERILEKSPYFDDNIFENLPTLLKKMCAQFDIKRERDIFFISELTVLSVGFPSIKGIYWNEEIYANIYSLTIAGFGSGKSAAKFALHTLYRFKQEEKRLYDLQMEEFKKNGSNGEPPKEKNIKISGDSSVASLFQRLEANGGSGLIFESEADTIADSMKMDWGNYDTILRKAFQHEPIATSRMNYSVDIDQPKISLGLTGTPKQMTTLIRSSENGLFSRFLYYIFESKEEFLNPFIGQNKNEFFRNISHNVYEIIKYYEEITPEIKLTAEQGERFTKFFNEKGKELNILHDEDILSIVKRLGTISFKILIILTVLRNYENRNIFEPERNVLYVSDIDLDVVFSIIKTSVKHTEIVFVNLSKQENVVIKENPKELLLNFILSQNEFKRKKVVDKGKELNISSATVDRLLKDLLANNKIIKDSYSSYRVNK